MRLRQKKWQLMERFSYIYDNIAVSISAQLLHFVNICLRQSKPVCKKAAGLCISFRNLKHKLHVMKHIFSIFLFTCLTAFTQIQPIIPDNIADPSISSLRLPIISMVLPISTAD